MSVKISDVAGKTMGDPFVPLLSLAILPSDITTMADATPEYPGGLDTHFWKWQANNCAPATFLTNLELAFHRISLPWTTASDFGTVVVSRGDESQRLVFDAWHKKLAGCRPNTCGVHQRPQAGCCAYGEFIPYTYMVEKIVPLLEGNDALLKAVQFMQHRRSSQKLRVADPVVNGFTMEETLNALLHHCVGEPPRIMQVELDHCEFVPGVKGRRVAIPGQLSSWDGTSPVQVLCGKDLNPCSYALQSVTFSDGDHYSSMVFDVAGGK
jgi:hypothetical protein